MTLEERERTLSHRRSARRPWHSPPHRVTPGITHYIVSAACYEHRRTIGRSPERMDAFSASLLAIAPIEHTYAWCVLPNHYHLVLQVADIKAVLKALGQLHGTTSYEWNGEDNDRGRKTWYNAAERELRSDAHLWASINYVHHNPVKHRYVDRWQEWPWSNAASFVETVGRERALDVWANYPVLEYGRGWDDDSL